MQFKGNTHEPTACKIAIGKVNAISDKPWNQNIVKNEQQDYVAIPSQPWLDGINAGDSYINLLQCPWVVVTQLKLKRQAGKTLVACN